MKRSEWPKPGDIVIVKIKSITPYGAMADMIEYPGREGFIHVSQVSSSWVKNIRSFISIGQLRAAMVEFIDQSKNSANLSLRKVSEQQQSRKMEDYKREIRADKIFEQLAKEIGEDPVASYEKIAVPLSEEYGDLMSVFENVKAQGIEIFKDSGISKKWQDAIFKYADANIKLSEVVIKGELTLKSTAGNGVELIKEALAKGEKKGVDLYYISAPKYSISVHAMDYEEAEKTLEKTADSIIEEMKKKGGTGSFERVKD